MRKLKKKKKIEYKIEEKQKRGSIIIFGIFIITFVVLFSNTKYIDDAIKCNNIKGEYCTDYEIDKYLRGDYK